MNERCETCRYWRGTKQTFRIGAEWVEDGQCRRAPPPWHNTMANDWCGEWREREPQPWDVQQR